MNFIFKTFLIGFFSFFLLSANTDINQNNFTEKTTPLITKTISDEDKVNRLVIGLTTKEKAFIKKHPILKVANESDYPPFDFTDDFTKNGKPVGYSIDIMNLIAQKIGVDIEYVNDSWGNLIAKIKNKKIDLIHTLKESKERKEFLIFSDGFMKTYEAIFTQKNTNDIKKFKDFKDKKIGFIKGENLTSIIQKKTNNNFEVLLYDDYVKLLKALSFGNIDAVILDVNVGQYLIKKHALYNLKTTGDATDIDGVKKDKEFVIGIRDDYPILKDIVNKGLYSIRKEEFDYLDRKWFGTSKVLEIKTIIKLSNEEKKWLDHHKTIRFAGDPNWMPLESFNDKGEYVGIIADYIKIIEKMLDIKFKKIQTKNFEETVKKARNYEVDVISEVVESDLKSKFIFTNPYIDNNIVMVMNKKNNYVEDLDDIKDKKIAAIKGYGYLPKVHKAYPDIKFEYVDNIQDGLMAVSTGKVDAFISTFILASYHISNLGISNIKIVGKTKVVTEIGLGVRKDLKPFVSILNKAFDSIDDAQKQKIFKRWIKQDYVEKVDYTLLYKGATAALILLLIFVFWNRKMAQEINKRKEIEDKLQDSSARMSTLFDASPDSISILDANGNYVDCNEATLKMFGLLSKDKFLELKPSDLSPKLQYNNQPSSEVAQKEIAIAFKKGINKFEWIHKRIDTGAQFDTEVILSLVSLENKPHVYGVVRDITKTKKAQKELVEIQDKQRLIIENKVKELTLKQTTQLKTIERSNNLLSGRENKMVELKSEINEYALKLGVKEPYVIVDETQTNLLVQSQEIRKEIDIKTLLDIPKLQVLLEDFHRFMNIPLAIIDLEGNVLVQSKWSRACTDFHRANSESCKRCIESDIDISHKLEEGKNFSVYKCKNGLIDCASPIIVDGKHFANFFIGQFLIEEPDIDFFTNQAKFFGYDVNDYISAIKDAVVISEDRLPHILGFLKEITEMIATLSTEKLNFERQEKNMSKANIASMNLAEDAQKATKEIETYKNHLEDLVNERTDELNNQKEFVQTLLDSQEQLIITTNGQIITSANQTFYDFYNVQNIEEFKADYEADCICETFNTNAQEGYLQIKMGDESWIDYVIARSDSSYTHKAMISKRNVDYIFSVSAVILPGEDGLKSAVFTNITEMENAKQEVEAINKHTRESIEYASLIQSALIPDNISSQNYFQDYFAIWQPKDIVGGDIHLFEELRDKDECLLMVIDCTGHGVPGAFVTMLVKAIERQVIAKINNDITIDVSPAWILSYFNRKMKILLKQEDKDSVSNAGFDGGVIYFNKKEKILKFSGAETPLFYIEDEEIKTIKGSRHSIGYKRSDANFEFKEHIIEVKDGMRFYCTTDGYYDQNGGEKGFSFGKKRFTNLIKECHVESMVEQKEILLNTLAEYQGNEERSDDVTLVGFKI